MKLFRWLRKIVFFYEDYCDASGRVFRNLDFPLFNRKIFWVKNEPFSIRKFFFRKLYYEYNDLECPNDEELKKADKRNELPF